MKYFILILFPGEKIGSESNKQEDGQQEKNGPGDLMGTFVFDKLPDRYLGFFFRLQFICGRLLALL